MTTTTQILSDATTKQVRTVKLEDRAVLCRIKRSSFGSSKKVSTAKIEVDAEKRKLRVSKKLLESAELDAIQKIDQDISAYIASNTLPSGFEAGMYFVPLVTVAQNDKKLTEFAVLRELAADKLSQALPTIIEQDRAALRDCFTESDYPTTDALRSSFKMDWSYMALTAPKSLEAVSEELYLSAKEKMEMNVQEASEAVRMVLRVQFKGLVDHLVDKLTPSQDGKKKKIYDSMTEKINGFLETFQARNITDDAELQRLVQDAKALVAGVGSEELRTDENMRGNIRASFEVIREELDGMVGDAPLRKIMALDEEE